MSLSGVINDVMNVMDLHAAEAGVELYHDARGWDGEDVTVYTDPINLRSIFINVLENTVKYNRKGGSIIWTDYISYGSGNTLTYKCVISDTGIGMDQEYIKHVFELFSQENAAVRTNYQGIGLGLSIVKSLIDRMGGTINVESRQGEGRRVDISLPFVAAADDGTDNAADADENGAAGADDSTASVSDADKAGKECKKNSEDPEEENTKKNAVGRQKDTSCGRQRAEYGDSKIHT